MGLEFTIDEIPADIRFAVLCAVLGEASARDWMPQ
jgi:hypothetical protein